MPTPTSALAPDSTKKSKIMGRLLQDELGSKAKLSPMPILFAFPMTEEFSAKKMGVGFYDMKDDGMSNSIGPHFTHPAFTVNSGQDVAARIYLHAPDIQAISISGSGTIQDS